MHCMAEISSSYSQHIHPLSSHKNVRVTNESNKTLSSPALKIQMIHQLHKRNSTQYKNFQSETCMQILYGYNTQLIKTYAKVHTSRNPKCREIKLGVFHGWHEHGIKSINHQNIKILNQLIANSQPNFYPLRIHPYPGGNVFLVPVRLLD